MSDWDFTEIRVSENHRLIVVNYSLSENHWRIMANFNGYINQPHNCVRKPLVYCGLWLVLGFYKPIEKGSN